MFLTASQDAAKSSVRKTGVMLVLWHWPRWLKSIACFLFQTKLAGNFISRCKEHSGDCRSLNMFVLPAPPFTTDDSPAASLGSRLFVIVILCSCSDFCMLNIDEMDMAGNQTAWKWVEGKFNVSWVTWGWDDKLTGLEAKRKRRTTVYGYDKKKVQIYRSDFQISPLFPSWYKSIDDTCFFQLFLGPLNTRQW